MNIEIAKKYGVNFQNTVSDDGTIEKIPYSKAEFLNLFLFECKLSDIDDVDDGLLTQIDSALANINSEIESGCGIVYILIYQDIVKFYINDDIDSMPTVDFREIIVGWRDFLLQPPLNGSKLKIKYKMMRLFKDLNLARICTISTKRGNTRDTPW